MGAVHDKSLGDFWESRVRKRRSRGEGNITMKLGMIQLDRMDKGWQAVGERKEFTTVVKPTPIE